MRALSTPTPRTLIKCDSVNNNKNDDYKRLKKNLKKSTAAYGTVLSSLYYFTQGGESGLSVALGAVASYAYLSLLSDRIDKMEGFQKEFFAPFSAVAFELSWNNSHTIQFDYGATFVGFLAYKLALSTVLYEIVKDMLIADSGSIYERKVYKENVYADRSVNEKNSPPYYFPPASRTIKGIDDNYDGSGKTVLITGANSGIGLEAAKQLCASGCHVLVAARSAEKARVASEQITCIGGCAEPVVIDLGDLNAVRRFAWSITQQGRSIDAIVCNAGIAPDRSLQNIPSRTKDGFEETIGVNYLAHFALVRDLIPVLSKGSRVVITSSCLHDPKSPDGRNGLLPTLGNLRGLRESGDFEMCDGGAFDANKAYKDSKLCGILFARELSNRFKSEGIISNAFSPGFCPSSGLFRHQSWPMRYMLKLAFDYPPLATSIENAGTYTLHMVLGNSTGDITGGYFCGPPSYSKSENGGFICGLLSPEFGTMLPSVEALDDKLGKELWSLSEARVDDKTKEFKDWLNHSTVLGGESCTDWDCLVNFD